MANRDLAALPDEDALPELLRWWRDEIRRRDQVTEVAVGGNWLLGRDPDTGDLIATNTETDAVTILATA